MDTLKAAYLLNARADNVDALAEALAREQSVEVPMAAVRSDFVRENTLGRVAGIEPVTDRQFRVTLELSVATTGFEAGQLMNMLFGNCSMHSDVQLVDVEFPPALLSAFPGPRFGLAGIRQSLNVPDRAMTCTALKPQGLDPAALAALCGTFAQAGIDVIKDDHGLADQAYAPFTARVKACQATLRALARERGHQSCYAPNLSGGPSQLREQLKVADGEGVEMVLAAPMIMGLPTFQELARDVFRGPVLTHPTFSCAMRIAPPVLYGRLFRLFGADAVIFPNSGGRFDWSGQTCQAIVETARAPWGKIAPALPVAGGGMTVDRISDVIAAYGTDTMLLVGGNLLSTGDALLERTQEFVAAVSAASVGAPRRPEGHRT